MADLNEQINKDAELQKIINAVDDRNFYIVGGYVRDALKGKRSDDIDVIFTDIDAQKAARKLAQKLDGHFVVLDE